MIDGVRHHTSSDYLLWSRLKLTKYWPLSLKRICIGSCILVTASAGCCLARPRLPLLRSGSDCICAAEVRAARAGGGGGGGGVQTLATTHYLYITCNTIEGGYR